VGRDLAPGGHGARAIPRARVRRIASAAAPCRADHAAGRADLRDAPRVGRRRVRRPGAFAVRGAPARRCAATRRGGDRRSAGVRGADAPLPRRAPGDPARGPHRRRRTEAGRMDHAPRHGRRAVRPVRGGPVRHPLRRPGTGPASGGAHVRRVRAVGVLAAARCRRAHRHRRGRHMDRRTPRGGTRAAPVRDPRHVPRGPVARRPGERVPTAPPVRGRVRLHLAEAARPCGDDPHRHPARGRGLRGHRATCRVAAVGGHRARRAHRDGAERARSRGVHRGAQPRSRGRGPSARCDGAPIALGRCGPGDRRGASVPLGSRPGRAGGLARRPPLRARGGGGRVSLVQRRSRQGRADPRGDATGRAPAC
jgi:hypothetical protein